MVTSPWRERREVWREKRKVRIFGKGKCKLIANCANFWQVKVWIHRQSRDNGDVTSVSISLSLCISLSLSPKVPHAQYRKRFRASYNIGIDGPTSVFDPAPGVKVGCCGQNLRVVTLCANDLPYFRSSSNSSLIELRRSWLSTVSTEPQCKKTLGLRNWMPSSQRSRDFLLPQGQPASKHVLLFSVFLAHRESLFDKTALSLQLTVV